jgi:hypothetical protein
MISRGRMRFLRPCIKCGMMFRPIGGDSDVCNECKKRINVLRYEKISERRRSGSFFVPLRTRLMMNGKH